jgi:hypothetical protein
MTEAEAEPIVGVDLLYDCRRVIFEWTELRLNPTLPAPIFRHKRDRIWTKDLLNGLYRLVELGEASSDWTAYAGLREDKRPHKLNERDLAAALLEFGVKRRGNGTVRIGDKTAKGWMVTWFEEAWAIWLEPMEAPPLGLQAPPPPPPDQPAPSPLPDPPKPR